MKRLILLWSLLALPVQAATWADVPEPTGMGAARAGNAQFKPLSMVPGTRLWLRQSRPSKTIEVMCADRAIGLGAAIGTAPAEGDLDKAKRAAEGMEAKCP